MFVKQYLTIMEHHAKSLRPFIGAKDYELSRRFYRELGFEETVLSHNMCVFKTGDLSFYLQDAYVQDWVDNTMLFLEVADLDGFWKDLLALDLPGKFPTAKLGAIRDLDWGREGFIHDPAGNLWHVGMFFA